MMTRTTDVDRIVAATRAFIRESVVPRETVPIDFSLRRELQQNARDAGVFAPHVSPEFGGLGLPISSWSPIFQEAGYSPLGPMALNIMAPDEGNMAMIEQIGTDEQKDAYLRPLAAGETRSCFAMTEPHPGAGSDPAALRTVATRVDGGWVVNGEKRFISGAVGAGFAIVMARNEASQGVPKGATMLIVDTASDGFRIGEQIHTTETLIEGGHPYVTFDDVFVPDANVLGKAGEGFRYAQVRLGPARLTHCMRWLGLARRAHDTALDRIAEREIFGSTIGELGIAQELVASNEIDIETSDAIITKTAAHLESDPRAGSALSSIAKVHCSEAAFSIIDRSIQLLGGDGVSSALPLAGYLNDVRPFRIYDGSNETHRWAVARRANARRARERDAGAVRLDETRHS